MYLLKSSFIVLFLNSNFLWIPHEYYYVKHIAFDAYCFARERWTFFLGENLRIRDSSTNETDEGVLPCWIQFPWNIGYRSREGSFIPPPRAKSSSFERGEENFCFRVAIILLAFSRLSSLENRVSILTSLGIYIYIYIWIIYDVYIELDVFVRGGRDSIKFFVRVRERCRKRWGERMNRWFSLPFRRDKFCKVRIISRN